MSPFGRLAGVRGWFGFVPDDMAPRGARGTPVRGGIYFSLAEAKNHPKTLVGRHFRSKQPVPTRIHTLI